MKSLILLLSLVLLVAGQQPFTFITLTIPTVTQFITPTITPTPTTVITTILTTETLTPGYFNDQNIITQDIVSIILTILIVGIVFWTKSRQRTKQKLNIAERYLNDTLRTGETVNNTITPIATTIV